MPRTIDFRPDYTKPRNVGCGCCLTLLILFVVLPALIHFRPQKCDTCYGGDGLCHHCDTGIITTHYGNFGDAVCSINALCDSCHHTGICASCDGYGKLTYDGQKITDRNLLLNKILSFGSITQPIHIEVDTTHCPTCHGTAQCQECIDAPSYCSICNTTGKCRACGGTGNFKTPSNYCPFCWSTGKCQKCHGRGLEPHLESCRIPCSQCYGHKKCNQCFGTGQLINSDKYCPYCYGDQKCYQCRGRGRDRWGWRCSHCNATGKCSCIYEGYNHY